MNIKNILAIAIFPALAISISLPSYFSVKTEIKKQNHESETEALDALQFLSMAVAFPNKDIPNGGYGKAFEFMQNNFATNKMMQSQSVGSWSNIGPRNLGGRTLCVIINPQDTDEVWMGSASGGLWKSTTGGYGVNAWTYVPTGFPILGVSTIAMNPNNPNEMYIGTGETYNYGTSNNGVVDRTTRGTCGMGIYKTTDGGLTWTQSLNWTYQQQRGIWEIIYNPLNTNILYAASTEGIYKTSDAGVTWNQVLNVQMAMDLAIDRIDTNILYCGVGNLNSVGKGIYKTTNSGTTWTQLTNGLPSFATVTGRTIVSTYYSNPNIVMALVSDMFNAVGVYISTNEGVTWTAGSNQDLTQWQGWFAKGLLIHPNDSSQVLVGGVEIHGSYDMGQNFLQLTDYWASPPIYMHSDVHDIIVNPLDPQKVYIATDAGLYRSNDFGQTYTELVDGYVTSQFYYGSVSSTDSTVALAGAQDEYTNKYSGSQYWLSVIGGDGSCNAIDPSNDQVQYGSYQYLNVLKSYDQGFNFFDQILNTSSVNAAFIAPFILCPSNPNIIYAGGDALQVSLDGGVTFSYVGNNPINNGAKILSIAVSSTFEDSVYLTTAPDATNAMKIWRSTNGGATLTDISAGLPNRYLREIVVNPNNSKIVYAVFSGFGTGHIFKSTNAGATWTNISTTLPDMPFHCLAVDPMYPNNLFAGCDFGIFLSQDGGVTWATYNTGFPDAVMIFDLVISPSDRRLMAFSHGHGVYVRKLSDAVGINETSPSLAQLSVFPNPATDFIFVELKDKVALNTTVTLYDLQGKKIKEVSSASDKIKVDVADLSPAVYLVEIENGKAKGVKKVIVQ